MADFVAVDLKIISTVFEKQIKFENYVQETVQTKYYLKLLLTFNYSYKKFILRSQLTEIQLSERMSKKQLAFSTRGLKDRV